MQIAEEVVTDLVRVNIGSNEAEMSSIGTLVRLLNLSCAIMHKYLKKNLESSPYKIQCHEALHING